MATHAKGTFEVKSWDEQPYEEIGDEAKLTRAHVTHAYDGAIKGEGGVEYLMAYANSGFATFVGLLRVVGRVGDRSGSFVLQARGTFENNLAKATWSVVPGAGTGDLRGLRGDGGFAAEHGKSTVPYTLDYDFE